MTIIALEAGNGTADDALRINAALSDSSVTTVVLGAGLFSVDTPIVVPSGKTLLGAGRDLSLIRVTDTFHRPEPSMTGVVNTEPGAQDVVLRDFGVDAGLLRPGGDRLHGVFMCQATDFHVERVDVHNTTAYGHFAQGDANRMTMYSSGRYDDCATYNCSVHYEQMFCDGIVLSNCHAREGAGTYSGTFFHPVLGSKNITYIDCTGYGRANAGFELTADWILPLENIRIINSSVGLFGDISGAAIIAAGSSAILGLEIVNSRFIAHRQAAGLLYGVTATIADSYFQGEAIGLIVYNGNDGIVSEVVVTDSHIVGLRDPLAQAGAYGVAGAGSAITIVGGIVEARGAPGLMWAAGTTGVTFSPTTKQIVAGYDASLAIDEQAAPTALAPGLLFGDPAADYSGGALLVSHSLLISGDDRFGIAHAGSGPGEIGVSGNLISYGGIPIASFSGGAGTAPLVITFLAGATGEAAQALARAITFTNTGEIASASSRAFLFRLLDAQGVERDQASASAVINPVDDPTILSLAAAPLSVPENGGWVAVAPGALLSDVDSSRIGGGTLTVGFGAAAHGSDEIAILHQGHGAGQIGIGGNSVWFDGVPLGTFTGGTAGQPLVVVLAPGATLPGVQALLRAVAFMNASDAPPAGERSLEFALEESDGTAVSGIVTVSIAASDDLPVPADDTAEGLEGVGFVIDALLNDDPDGGPQQIVEIDGIEVAPGGWVDLASGARVTLREDGTLFYQPPAAWDRLVDRATGAANGSALDSFVYREAGGGTAVVRVTVKGVTGPGDSLEGSAGDDAIVATGTAARFRLEQGGEDDARGGGGDDLFFLGTALSAGDRFKGGSGSDALLLQGSQSVRLVTGQLVGIEMLAVLSADETGFGAGGGGPYQYRVAMDDGAVDAGGTLLVHAGSLGAGETLEFDASLVTGASFHLHGGAGDDVLSGGALADRLDGGAGADRLSGGGGDDLYLVDDAGDLVIEAADGGTDEVRTAVGSRDDHARMYVLPAFVENFTGLSSAGQGVFGNALDNVITMGSGSDLVVLQEGGKDSVYGGGGDDFLYFGSALTEEDLIDGGSGYDTLGLLGSYTLAFSAGNLTGIEKLAVYSSGGGHGVAPNHYWLTTQDSNVAAGQQLTVVGLSLLASESLVFNGAAETDGSFNLRGGRGDDRLTGGAGRDQLYGNLGADILQGGAGADVFEYHSAAESTAGARDTILDFGAGDKLNLIAIDANGDAVAGNGAFSFIGNKAFSNTAGELRITAARRGGWLVEGDTDGDGTADLVILVHTVSGAAPGVPDIWF